MRIFSLIITTLLMSSCGGGGSSSGNDSGTWGAIGATPQLQWSWVSSRRNRANAVGYIENRLSGNATILSFENACGAIAIGSNRFGLGYTTTIQGARDRALTACRRRGRNCRIVHSFCSP